MGYQIAYTNVTEDDWVMSLLTDDQCRNCYHGPHGVPCTDISEDPGPGPDWLPVKSVCGCRDYVDLEAESRIVVPDISHTPVGDERMTPEREAAIRARDAGTEILGEPIDPPEGVVFTDSCVMRAYDRRMLLVALDAARADADALLDDLDRAYGHSHDLCDHVRLWPDCGNEVCVRQKGYVAHRRAVLAARSYRDGVAR
jgi:hypothetical protein